MRYFVRVETKTDYLYLYMINHNTPSLAMRWQDATLFRTKEEAIHGMSLIRQNFSSSGIKSMEVRGVNLIIADDVVAKEMF